MTIKFIKGKVLSYGIVIITNLIPIYGVLFSKWNIFSILFLYWAESAIIGFFNFLMVRKIKMLIPVGKDSPFKSVRYLSISMFIGPYSLFMLVHGLLILLIFRPFYISFLETFVAFLFLVLNHAFSYAVDFLWNQGYRKVAFDKQLFFPFRRLLVMHITVFFGGLLVKFIGIPLIALVFLVVLKIFVELFDNWVERHLV